MNRLHLHSHNFRRSGHVCRTSGHDYNAVLSHVLPHPKIAASVIRILYMAIV